MIYKKLIIVTLISIYSCASLKKDSTSNFMFDNKVYENFLGKEVFNFLVNDSFRNYQDISFFDQKPASLSGLMLSYSDGTVVYLYVDKFQFQEKFNITRNWDMNLLYKEKISRIKVNQDAIELYDSSPSSTSSAKEEINEK